MQLTRSSPYSEYLSSPDPLRTRRVLSGLHLNAGAVFRESWVGNDILDLPLVPGTTSEDVRKLQRIDHRGEVFYAEIIEMTAPAVLPQKLECFSGVPNCARSPFWIFKIERVQVDVIGNVHEMGVSRNMHFLKCSLPENAAAFVFIIKILRIPHIQLLHKGGDAVFGDRG